MLLKFLVLSQNFVLALIVQIINISNFLTSKGMFLYYNFCNDPFDRNIQIYKSHSVAFLRWLSISEISNCLPLKSRSRLPNTILTMFSFLWHISNSTKVYPHIFALSPIVSEILTFQILYLQKERSWSKKYRIDAIRWQISKCIKINPYIFALDLIVQRCQGFKFVTVKKYRLLSEYNFYNCTIRWQI